MLDSLENPQNARPDAVGPLGQTVDLTFGLCQGIIGFFVLHSENGETDD